MDWRIKGLVQKSLSVIPGGLMINDYLQRSIGLLRDFEPYIPEKVSDWASTMKSLRDLGINPKGLRFLEIGTGWIPMLPICYSLLRAETLHTFDQIRHLNPVLTLRMVRLLKSHLDKIAEASLQPLEEIQETYEILNSARTIEDLLKSARIQYHAPADATATGLPSDSIDVVVSNDVLEHVPGAVIYEMMKESQRILRPGGLIVHNVHCGDHYEKFDRKITAINYLAYSERHWRLWTNKLNYQNRLRPRDFLGFAEKAGLEVISTRSKPRKDYLEALPKLRIAAEFQKYPPEELCTTWISFVARKR